MINKYHEDADCFRGFHDYTMYNQRANYV
jgi:hypothetical protein